jgi:hypothetical protein
VAYNTKSIFTSRRDRLHVLNRLTGRERVYTLDAASKLPTFGFRLESSPTAAPVADEEMIFFAFGRRLVAYQLPIFEIAERLRESDIKGETMLKESSLQPEYAWGFKTDGNIEILQPPLQAAGQFSVISSDGTLMSVNQFDGQPRYDYKFQGGVLERAGQHGPRAYVGSDDYTLYAMDMRNGRLLWRLLSGGPIAQKVEVTDADVYVTSQRRGLFRADRQTGDERWLNRTAERFLATNQKLVYALDAKGRFLVLDYARGNQLASYDLSEWVVPLSNEITDRIYFANHDGQVMCLHHRDQVTPLRTKTFEAREEKKPKEPKEGEKEKEKDKDKDEKVGGFDRSRMIHEMARNHTKEIKEHVPFASFRVLSRITVPENDRKMPSP